MRTEPQTASPKSRLRQLFADVIEQRLLGPGVELKEVVAAWRELRYAAEREHIPSSIVLEFATEQRIALLSDDTVTNARKFLALRSMIHGLGIFEEQDDAGFVWSYDPDPRPLEQYEPALVAWPRVKPQ